MAGNPVRKFLDFLAKMGLSVRDDPPKVVDFSIREWGPVSNGFVLSASGIPNDDSAAVPAVSIVLRNVGFETAKLLLPSWLALYRIEVSAPDGSPVTLTSYGRELLRRERKENPRTLVLESGAISETEIPIGAIYSMRAGTRYAVSVSCEISNGNIQLSANPLII